MRVLCCAAFLLRCGTLRYVVVRCGTLWYVVVRYVAWRQRGITRHNVDKRGGTYAIAWRFLDFGFHSEPTTRRQQG